MTKIRSCSFTLIDQSLTFIDLLGNKNVSICDMTFFLFPQNRVWFFLAVKCIKKGFIFCICTPGLLPGVLVMTQLSTPRRIYTGGLECVDCDTKPRSPSVNNKCVNSWKNAGSPFAFVPSVLSASSPAKNRGTPCWAVTLQQLAAPRSRWDARGQQLYITSLNVLLFSFNFSRWNPFTHFISVFSKQCTDLASWFQTVLTV